MPFQPRSSKLSNKQFLIFDFDETIDTLVMDWSSWPGNVLRIIQKYDRTVEIPLNDIHFETEIGFIEKFGESINQDFIAFQERFEQENYQSHEPNQPIVNFIRDNTDQVIFIWSNNHGRTVAPILHELGLSGRIKICVTRDMVSFPKPHLAGFKQLFIPDDQLAETLFIGDASPDEKAAAEIGIDYLHVDDFVRLIKE